MVYPPSSSCLDQFKTDDYPGMKGEVKGERPWVQRSHSFTYSVHCGNWALRYKSRLCKTFNLSWRSGRYWEHGCDLCTLEALVDRLIRHQYQRSSTGYISCGSCSVSCVLLHFARYLRCCKKSFDFLTRTACMDGYITSTNWGGGNYPTYSIAHESLTLYGNPPRFSHATLLFCRPGQPRHQASWTEYDAFHEIDVLGIHIFDLSRRQ